MCSVIPFDRLRTDLWLAPQGMKRGQVVILSVANGSAFSDIRRVKRPVRFAQGRLLGSSLRSGQAPWFLASLGIVCVQ